MAGLHRSEIIVSAEKTPLGYVPSKLSFAQNLCLLLALEFLKTRPESDIQTLAWLCMLIWHHIAWRQSEHRLGTSS